MWLLAGIILLLAAAGMMLWRKRKSTAVPALADTSALDAGTFDAALTVLYKLGTARDRYDIPCVLVCGEKDSGKSDILRAARLEPVITAPGEYNGWWRNMDGTTFELPDAALNNKGTSGPWSDCLALFKEHRGQRPLDALIWVLPLSALNVSDDASKKLLTDMGTRMSEKFFDIQNRLGLRLPVYVVVSKCDAVSGFAEFASQLSPQLREQSLGWSNPYGLGKAFQKVWAEQGLAAVIKNLRMLVTELGAQTSVGNDFTDMFLLPDRLSDALSSLPNLLQLVFRQNATLESFDLRGMYLSGWPKEAQKAVTSPPDPFGPAPVSMVAGTDSSIPVFCRQLFSNRIFAEFGLAILVPRKLTGERSVRDRIIWGSCGVAAVWLVCMLVSYPGALKQARSMLVPLKVIGITNNKQEQLRMQSDTVALLKSMDMVPDWSMKFALLPMSWGSGLNDKIQAMLQKFYQETLFKSFDVALVARASKLVQPELSVGLGASNEPAAIAPNLMPEFTSFRDFVDQSLLYESERNKFINMTKEKQGSWADAASLISYLFELTPAPRSKESLLLFNEMIQKSTYSPTQTTDSLVQHKFELRLCALHEVWLSHLFGQTGLTESIENLKTSLLSLAAGDMVDHTALRELQHAIQDLRTLLTRTNLTGTNDGTEYAGILKKIAKSTMLGASDRSIALQKSAAHAQENFGSEISDGASGEDAVLDYIPGKNLLIKPDIIELEQFLARLLAHPFAQEAVIVASAKPLQGSGLIEWDLTQLEMSGNLYQDYLAYETTELGKAPIRFQATLQKIARDQISNVIRHGMEQAIGLAGRGNDWHSSNFDSAQKQITPMIAALRKLNQIPASLQWQERMDQQAQLLLKNIDVQFDNSKLYFPDELAVNTWDGKRFASQRVFGVSTPADLQDYLAAQMNQISTFVDASKPPRAWLERGKPVPLAGNWLSLETELGKYAGKNPAGSIKQLEQLITDDLNAIDSTSCSDKMAHQSQARDGDYFQKRGRNLTVLFSQRCAGLQNENTRIAYAAITDHFNRVLLNRYPFTSSADAPPAEPDQVRELLRLLDVNFALARDGLAHQQNGSTLAASAFLEKLGNIKPLMAALLSLDPVTGGPVTIDLWPEFRVNRGREKGADQIIEWSIETGLPQQNPLSKVNPLSWRLGDPMAMSLRWAKDSDISPAPDLTRFPNMQINAKKAIFQYAGSWALLHLMKDKTVGVSELIIKETLQPQVLRFIVPTRYSSGLPFGDAIVFGRLGIAIHGKPERLSVPAFPNTSAPLLLPVLPQLRSEFGAR